MRIILVDDEKLIREMCRTVLQILGHDAHIVESGQEVLKLLRDNDYDLLITDIKMPEMDGWTLAEAVRTINSAIKIMVITGHFEERLKGTDMVIVQKPFTIRMLQRGIEQATAPKEQLAYSQAQ